MGQNKITPITPTEAAKSLNDSLPEYVFEGVNNAIKERYRGESAFKILQKDIVEAILKVAPVGTTSTFLFDKHYMDFENHYRKAGWLITYDKPAYNECYEATFEFKAKKSTRD